MPLRYRILDVFAKQPFSGNQLAVVDDLLHLTPAEMLKIAAEFGYSETVFLRAPATDGENYSMRIFTPTMELDFAGHPTLGATADILFKHHKTERESLRRMNIVQSVGVVDVAGQSLSDYKATCELALPFIPECREAPIPVGHIAAMLGIGHEDIGFDAYHPKHVTAGPSFLFVPLSTQDVLYRCDLDMTAWRRDLANTPCPNVYMFTQTDDHHFHARMFAPAMGQREDAATGAAAGGLAAYLNFNGDTHDFGVIYQGKMLGRDSELSFKHARPSKGRAAIVISGSVFKVAEGLMYL